MRNLPSGTIPLMAVFLLHTLECVSEAYGTPPMRRDVHALGARVLLVLRRSSLGHSVCAYETVVRKKQGSLMNTLLGGTY